MLSLCLRLVTVCGAMVQAKCLHLIVSLFVTSLTMGTAAEVVASRHSGGRTATLRCWYAILKQLTGRHCHSTTAAASGRRDACGTAVPFRPERRGREAPSVAMKWRDAVKAAIMHGPLPPDVTFDAPHWWQPGMPLLPPANYMAPVPLKRKRDTSAEPKTDPFSPWQDTRSQHSPGEASGTGALRARGSRHVPLVA